MKVIICLDDDNGMLFNGRRLSRDREVVSKISEIIEGGRLWITEFSKMLFEDGVIVDNQMLDKAAEDEFCFVENLRLSERLSKIEKLYLFKWNRRYPSDMKIDFSISENFHLISREDFEGNSHEKMTLEVWER